MSIGHVDKPLALLVYRWFNGKGFDYADAIEDRKRVFERIQFLGDEQDDLAVDIAWEEAFERERIKERMNVCKRRIKRWRRLERRMRGKIN